MTELVLWCEIGVGVVFVGLVDLVQIKCIAGAGGCGNMLGVSGGEELDQHTQRKVE